MLILALAAGPAKASIDLSGLEVHPSPVAAGEELTLTVEFDGAHAVDASRLRATIINPDGGDTHWFSSWTEVGADRFESSITVQPNAVEGTWRVYTVLAYDTHGNGKFFRDGTDFVRTFQVTGEAPDDTPPVLTDVSVDPVVVVQGAQTRIAITLEDAPAGVNWDKVRGYLRNPAGGMHWLTGWEATGEPDTRDVAFSLPSDALIGTWTLSHLMAYDEANNARWFYEGVDYSASFQVEPRLQIVQQPSDQVVLEDEVASFEVQAIGAEPLSYQWFRDGVPIPGATQTALTLPGVTLGDDGALFHCEISNEYETLATAEARLTVVARDAPTFTQPPQDQRVLEGFAAVFEVEAFGPEPITYQWQRNGADVAGAQSPVLQIDEVSPADDGAVFRCLAANEFGVTTSAVAVLTVNEHPEGWAYRTQVSLSGYEQDEVLTNFPVLLRLNEAWPGFRYAQVADAAGGDVRFRDANGDDWLSHEVESWNISDDSDIWVRVPRIEGPDTFIWMYWGNPEETDPPAYTDDGSTWIEDYLAVWHLDDGGTDASPNDIHAANDGAVPVDGVVAGAHRFDGLNNHMSTTNFQPDGSVTVSMWLNMDEQTSGGSVWRTILANSAVDTMGFYLTARRENTTGELTLKIGTDTGFENIEFGDLGTGVWRYVAFTYDEEETRLRTFIDGSPAFNGTGYANIANEDVWIAGEPADASRRYRGDLDEIRISDRPRTPGWIWAKWRNQSDPDTFIEIAPITFPDQPFVDNAMGATDVTRNAAWLNGDLISTGAAPTSVRLYWGESDAGTNSGAWDQVVDMGEQEAGPLALEVDNLSDGTTYYYRFHASNAFGAVWSPDTAVFTTPSLSPEITEQPEPVHVDIDEPAMFSVTASGEEPLYYQWRKDGAELPGATDPALVWPSATRAEDGSWFQVEVSNAFGAVVSDEAQLTVQRLYTSRGFEAPLYELGSIVNQDGIGGSWLQWNASDGNFGQPLWARVQTNTVFAGRQALALTNAGERVIARRLFSPALDDTMQYHHAWIRMAPSPGEVDVFRIVLRWGDNNRLFPVTSDGSAMYDNADPDARVAFMPGAWNRVVIGLDASAQTYSLFVNQFTNFITGSIPAGSVTSWELDYSSTASLTEGFGAFVDDLYVDDQNPLMALEPVILSEPESRTVVEGETATFEITYAGAEPLAVQWRKDGDPIPGATNDVLHVGPVSLADSGNEYVCVLSNDYGVVTSAAAVLSVTISPDVLFDSVGFEPPLYSVGSVVGQHDAEGSWLQWNPSDGNFGQPDWTMIQTQKVFAGEQALALTNAGERVIARRLFSPSITNDVHYYDARIWTSGDPDEINLCRIVLRWSGGSRLFVFQSSGAYVYDNADPDLRASFVTGAWNRIVIRVDRSAGDYTFFANQSTNYFSGPLTTQPIASWELDYESTAAAPSGFGIFIDDLRVTVSDPLDGAAGAMSPAGATIRAVRPVDPEVGDRYDMQWNTLPGKVYLVERTPSLIKPEWEVLDEFKSDGHETHWVYDRLDDYPSGFLRLRERDE